VEKYRRDRQATDDNIIRRMRFACKITKPTNTYSEYVILIAFPRREWLCKRATILHYMYIASSKIYVILLSKLCRAQMHSAAAGTSCSVRDSTREKWYKVFILAVIKVSLYENFFPPCSLYKSGAPTREPSRCV
jgi:hypothetical protein